MIRLDGTNTNNFFRIKSHSLNFIDESSQDHFQNHYVQISNDSLMENNVFENYNYLVVLNGSTYRSLIPSNGTVATAFRRNITTKDIDNDYSEPSTYETFWSAKYTKSITDTNIKYYQNFVKQSNTTNLIETKNYYLANLADPLTKTYLPVSPNVGIDFVFGGMKNIGTPNTTRDNNQKLWIENDVVNNTTNFNIGGPDTDVAHRNIAFQSYGTGTIQNLNEIVMNTEALCFRNATLSDNHLVIYPSFGNEGCIIDSPNDNLKISTSSNYDIEVSSKKDLLLNSFESITIESNLAVADTISTQISLNSGITIESYDTVSEDDALIEVSSLNGVSITSDHGVTINSNEDIALNSFTKLGEDSIGIKRKTFHGLMNSDVVPGNNNTLTIVTGIPADKIISIDFFARDNVDLIWFPAGYGLENTGHYYIKYNVSDSLGTGRIYVLFPLYAVWNSARYKCTITYIEDELAY